MEGLRDNKPLLYSIVLSGGLVFSLATGVMPDLSNMFEIVDFPNDVSLCFSDIIYKKYLSVDILIIFRINKYSE